MKKTPKTPPAHTDRECPRCPDGKMFGTGESCQHCDLDRELAEVLWENEPEGQRRHRWPNVEIGRASR